MKKSLYEKIFKNKKITVMGLGLLGRGIAVSKFLAESGAKLIITDLKSEKELKTSIQKLKKYKVTYHLGKHYLKDFEKKDMIIKSAGVPIDSPYIKNAKDSGVPVEMDASLFVKIVKKIYPKVKIVGITGTRGKSMTTALIYHILSENKNKLKANIFLGGNMRNLSTLPILKKIKENDIVVLELDSWQCQGFGDSKISPDIAIFTSFMKDHMNYYKNDTKKYLLDKSYIYRFQNKNNVFVTDKETLGKLETKPKSKIIIPEDKLITDISRLKLNIIGMHNVKNASFAYKVSQELGLEKKDIIKSLKTFKGLEGRLEITENNLGRIVINDNNATTPEATKAGIEAVKENYKKSRIILIAGGSDKTLDLSSLIKAIKNVYKTILLPGNGTTRLINDLKTDYLIVKDLKEAVYLSVKNGTKKDVILFSPGFASFGIFKNEYDRNDQFLKIIKNISKK
jgi:UDP-N-acetylmuramoylalanine--D-glutamate ligase